MARSTFASACALRMLAALWIGMFGALGKPVGSQGYGLHLWGCNANDSSKVTFANQRWTLGAGALVYNKTGGCVTASSANHSAPGSALHVAPCAGPCQPFQGWAFDAASGLIASTSQQTVCMGAVPSSNGGNGGPQGQQWAVVAQRCDGEGAPRGSLLRWRYDQALLHFIMDVDGMPHCLDGGHAVPPGPGLLSPKPVPSGQGCVTSVAKALPYCNTSLSDEERVKDILSRMTVTEKVAHLRGSGSHTVNATFPGVPRIGLPPFDWGLEGQHGLRINCVAATNSSGDVCPDPNYPGPASPMHCPTTWPGPPGLGATFNDSLVQSIGEAIGTEARAVNNEGGQLSGRLIVRTPVINLIRDPRWGRNVECPSEDPLHSGRYAAAMINGAQKQDARGRLLAGVEMKHFAVYQVEDCGGGGKGPGIPPGLPSCSRMKFDANISQAELNETYFGPFRGAVQGTIGGSPTGYMCSYNAVNGVPACANRQLSDAIRGWGFDGYCGTDCSAADGIFDAHGYTSDLPHAYAAAINGGTDLICNPHNMTALQEAVDTGLISTAALDGALARAFGVLMRLGMYDPVEEQPFTGIALGTLKSPSHMRLALAAARQSTVLLRNRNGTLPLPLPLPAAEPTRVVVIGPQGNATGQMGGNYFGSECADGTKIWANMSGGGGQDSWWPCVPSLSQAISSVVGGHGVVEYVQGCDQRCSGNLAGTRRDILSKEAKLNPDLCNGADLDGLAAAVEAARRADVVVLALGFDTAVAGEGHDRLDMGLPGAQGRLASAVLDAVRERRSGLQRRDKTGGSTKGSPPPRVVLALYASAAVSIDGLLDDAKGLDAILFGHMPGVTGGTAVAEALFGIHNDFGRLPYTVYPHVYQNQSSFVDMSFRTPPGRTHRFYTGTPLFSFGEGLSYAGFRIRAPADALAPPLALRAGQDRFNLTVVVRHATGALAGSHVVFCWLTPASPRARGLLAARLGQEPPRQVLVGYQRSRTLRPGEEQEMDLQVSVDSLAVVEAGTSRRLVATGEYELRLDGGPRHQSEGQLFRRVTVERDILF